MERKEADMHDPVAGPAGSPGSGIAFTVFQAEQPPRLSKGFSLDPQGQLCRQPGGMLTHGMAYTVQVQNLGELAAVLTQLTPAQATAYGISQHKQAR
jgi:hypothetical protein